MSALGPSGLRGKLFPSGFGGAALEVPETPREIPEDGLEVVIRSRAEDDRRTAKLEALRFDGYLVEIESAEGYGTLRLWVVHESHAEQLRADGYRVRRAWTFDEETDR